MITTTKAKLMIQPEIRETIVHIARGRHRGRGAGRRRGAISGRSMVGGTAGTLTSRRLEARSEPHNELPPSSAGLGLDAREV